MDNNSHWFIELGILCLYIGVALVVSNGIYLIIKYIIQTLKAKKKRYFIVFYSAKSKHYDAGGYIQSVTKGNIYISHAQIERQLSSVFEVKHPSEQFVLIINSVLELKEKDYNVFNEGKGEYETIISSKGEHIFVRGINEKS